MPASTASFRWTTASAASIAKASGPFLDAVASNLRVETFVSHRYRWGLDTGALRASYSVRSDTPLSRVVANEPAAFGGKKPYAIYVEFGTSRMKAQGHFGRAARMLAASHPQIDLIKPLGLG